LQLEKFREKKGRNFHVCVRKKKGKEEGNRFKIDECPFKAKGGKEGEGTISRGGGGGGGEAHETEKKENLLCPEKEWELKSKIV